MPKNATSEAVPSCGRSSDGGRLLHVLLWLWCPLRLQPGANCLWPVWRSFILFLLRSPCGCSASTANVLESTEVYRSASWGENQWTSDGDTIIVSAERFWNAECPFGHSHLHWRRDQWVDQVLGSWWQNAKDVPISPSIITPTITAFQLRCSPRVLETLLWSCRVFSGAGMVAFRRHSVLHGPGQLVVWWRGICAVGRWRKSGDWSLCGSEEMSCERQREIISPRARMSDNDAMIRHEFRVRPEARDASRNPGLTGYGSVGSSGEMCATKRYNNPSRRPSCISKRTRTRQYNLSTSTTAPLDRSLSMWSTRNGKLGIVCRHEEAIPCILGQKRTISTKMIISYGSFVFELIQTVIFVIWCGLIFWIGSNRHGDKSPAGVICGRLQISSFSCGTVMVVGSWFFFRATSLS